MRNSRRSFSSKKNRSHHPRRRNQSARNGRNKRSTLNHALLIKKAQPNKRAAEYILTHKFTDFKINNRLRNNVLARGYENPTPIQDQAIPHILEGKDIVGIANTGTGKTAAFLIPLINKMIRNQKSKVLIVTPTRELAMQVQDEFKLFARGLRLFSVLCIGGASINPQISNLRKKPHFIIGTPGRLKDLNERNKLNFRDCSTIVLDEVDRMLDMGFIQDIKHMISRLPQTRHSLFFSATMPDKVKNIMKSFLTNPVFVIVKTEPTSENVNQDIVKINGRVKIEVLHDLLTKDEFEKVLIFGRTKRGTEKLAKQLDRRGFKVASIHGDKTQGQRQRALKQFRDNRIQALLATDVASRGLDIDNITHVINYDLPETYEDYIHRIGRTGRADNVGSALSFVE